MNYLSFYGNDYTFDEVFSYYKSLNEIKTAISGWKLTDENGKEYHAIVQNQKMINSDYNFGEVMKENNSGYASDIFDDVQAEEINNAIEKELYRVFGAEESENNFFLQTNILQYSNAKFDGDIVKFLKYKNELALRTEKFTATYFYNDEKFSVHNNLDKEDYEFLLYATSIELVHYREKMPSKADVVSFQNAHNTNTEKTGFTSDPKTARRMYLWISHLPSIERVYRIDFTKGTSKDAPETWVQNDWLIMHQTEDMNYATSDKELNLEGKGELVEDLSEWADTVKTYQEENKEEWASHTAITKKYPNKSIGTYYYIKVPENTENKVYRLFIKQTDGTMSVHEIRNSLQITQNGFYVVPDPYLSETYICIAFDYISVCEEWFVVECELKK